MHRTAIKEQYFYAKDTLRYLDTAMSADGSSGYGADSWNRAFKQIDWWLHLKTVILVGVFYWFFLSDGGGLSKLMGDKMTKVEVKMAKNIEQRLEDVKGIDEIKDEI